MLPTFQKIESAVLPSTASEVVSIESVRVKMESDQSPSPPFLQHFQEIKSSTTRSPKKVEVQPSPKEVDCQRIRLEPEQASQVPFPPGCPVVVIDSSRISCTGEIKSVYISFARNTGSCDNCYDVSYLNCDGQTQSQNVKGTQLRYAMNCPIKIVSGDTDTKTSIDGIIKGFEVSSESTSDDSSSFLYTIEVSALGSNGQKRLLRHRGIGAEHIVFRPTAESSSYLTDEKSSIVSFEDSNSLKDDMKHGLETKGNHVDTEVNTISPQSTFDGIQQKSTSSPTSQQGDNNILQNDSNVPSSVVTTPYTKCTPLPPPIPSKFQGDMEKYSYSVVPEFCTLVNFPSSTSRQNMLPEGMKCCVMCGQSRDLSSPKTSKNRAKSFQGRSEQANHLPMIPAQNKGLCTYCDVNVWVVKESGLQIKWCKGCKNFQPWAQLKAFSLMILVLMCSR